jgi:hypothetical protein
LAAVRRGDRITRFPYDFPLLYMVLDRWRSETHTFHFAVNELVPTLQDAALLFGLRCEGKAMGAVDIAAN